MKFIEKSKRPPTTYDLIVLGAGAAGLMCAGTAGKRGKRVLLIEHNTQPGKKIVISGGGKCNFTNAIVSAENFQSTNPDFCRSALAQYGPEDFVGLVKSYDIPFLVKKNQQYFCVRSARDIVNLLLAECEKGAVELQCGTRVTQVDRRSNFILETDRGQFVSEQLVVATGGLSIPTLGASPFGYKIAEQFGHTIIKPEPALVPLIVRGFEDLAGVSLRVRIRLGRRVFDDDLLFTHRGLSGPAVLQSSLYWTSARHTSGSLGNGLESEMLIDFLPGQSGERLVNSMARTKGPKSIGSVFKGLLPSRFLETWCSLGLETPLTDLSRGSAESRAIFLNHLHRFLPEIAGTEGFSKAEVTRGGVDTNDLSSRTCESRKVPGLYFIGEVADVTGALGGFNFQWAWSSGFAAGQAI